MRGYVNGECRCVQDLEASDPSDELELETDGGCMIWLLRAKASIMAFKFVFVVTNCKVSFLGLNNILTH